MEPEEILNRVRDTVTIRQVFGEPIERDGTLVVPVARVRGGGGGGSQTPADPAGRDPAGRGPASGGGFGFDAKPLGVYVIREGRVSWQPAVDVSRIVLQGQLVAIFALLVVRGVLRRRHRRA